MSDAVPVKPIRRAARKRSVAKPVTQPEAVSVDVPSEAKRAVRTRSRRRNWRGDPRDTKDAAQELSLEAIATLGAIAADDGASPSARVAAATAILDRAFGRPSSSAGQEESSRTDLASFLATIGEGAGDPPVAATSLPVRPDTDQEVAAKPAQASTDNSATANSGHGRIG